MLCRAYRKRKSRSQYHHDIGNDVDGGGNSENDAPPLAVADTAPPRRRHGAQHAGYEQNFGDCAKRVRHEVVSWDILALRCLPTELVRANTSGATRHIASHSSRSLSDALGIGTATTSRQAICPIASISTVAEAPARTENKK